MSAEASPHAFWAESNSAMVNQGTFAGAAGGPSRAVISRLLASAACKADARGRFHAADVQRWWRAVRDGRPTPGALDAQAYTMVTYFLSFDEDKLGALDAPQFQNLYEGLLEGGYDLPNAADTMDLMDVNRNGTVSYAEFIAWFQGLLRSAASA